MATTGGRPAKMNFPNGQEEQVPVGSGAKVNKGDPAMGPPFLAAESLISDVNKGTLVYHPYFLFLAFWKIQVDALSAHITVSSDL